jgi:hypothetical protein
MRTSARQRFRCWKTRLTVAKLGLSRRASQPADEQIDAKTIATFGLSISTHRPYIRPVGSTDYGDKWAM